MFSLFIVTIIFSKSSAKLFFSESDDPSVYAINPRRLGPVSKEVEFVNRGEPLWVLSLSGNEWMEPKIRLGNTAELEEFFDYVGPLNRNRRRPSQTRVKKDDPERANLEVEPPPGADLQKEFVKMINKFAMSSSSEPDSYITDNSHDYDSTPSMALHFKGPYAILIVEIGRKQWHYFIRSQSSLPEWFYEAHDTRESPILLPEEVKIKLFNSLWRLLHLFFGHPV
nr:uncharacterized protein LOC110380742 isoform X1 [Helicoverpa armigera]